MTYKRNLPSFTFDGSARIIDWQGVSYPMAYTLGDMPEDGRYPDYRQTIYWHPLQTVQPGEDLQIPCRLPDYKGRFRVVVEGLSADGQPLRAETSFEVE